MVASTVARETPALESLEAAISHSGKRDLLIDQNRLEDELHAFPE